MSAAAAPAPAWRRLSVVHALQVPAAALAALSPSAWGFAAAGLWGSAVCCLGTDSGWRWLNRLLIAEAVVWLSLGLAGIL
jgi:hypothetical protein